MLTLFSRLTFFLRTVFSRTVCRNGSLRASQISTLLLTTLITFTLPTISHASEKLRLQIVEPFLDIRTGPGKNYPIFYVAQRNEQIEIQKRRNEWFKVALQVNSNDQKIGWVHRKSIGLTLVANYQSLEATKGQAQVTDNVAEDSEVVLAKDDPSVSQLFNPTWYVGFSYGQMTAADLVGVYAGKEITDSIAFELQAGEFLGRNSEGTTYAGAITFAPFPKWQVSPYAEIGGGAIHSSARGTNSQQNNGSDKFLQSGMGLNLLLSDRYRLRFEYRHMNVLTSKDQNEELETWHIGFIGYF